MHDEHWGYDEEPRRPLANASEAHTEWHRNGGIPMGTPGCPQDACHDDPGAQNHDQNAQPGNPTNDHDHERTRLNYDDFDCPF